MKPDKDWETPSSGEEPREEKAFSILHYVNILLKRRWLIIVGTLIVCGLAIIYSKLQTPSYEATAAFLPSRSQDMSSRLDASFGGGRATTDRYTENLYLVEYYSQILMSRDFLGRVAQKPLSDPPGGKPLTLADYYRSAGVTESERDLKALELITQSLKVTAPKATAGRTSTMTMTIRYAAPSPVIAAAAANLILDELVQFNLTEQNTKTKSNRVFIENQLKETQELLRKAEEARSNFQSRNKKLATPDLEVELERLKRNVKVQEEIYLTLNKQLELAKIQEQENKASIDIIQRAIPPRSRTKPAIKKTVVMAGFLGLMLFCILAIGLDYAKKIDPDEPMMKELLVTLKDVKGDASKAGRIFFGLGRKKPPKSKT